MRYWRLLILIILSSCRPVTERMEARVNLSFLDTIKTIKHFNGDSLKFSLTKEEVDKINLPPVDSLFYYKYLSGNKNFQGFNLSLSDMGGPSCDQYYYGIIQDRIPGHKQVLILQVYNFNDTENDLFLLTFDNQDSLQSILEVASLIFQAEIEPIFSSAMYPDNRVIKYEITIDHIPANMDSLTTNRATAYYPSDSTQLLFCTDSVRKEFMFSMGKYTLINKDSVRSCVWKTE